MKKVAAALLVLALASCAEPSGNQAPRKSVLVVVNAPFSRSPYIGHTIYQGAKLAAEQINSSGGVQVQGTSYGIQIEKMDDALSPARALSNVRQAVSDGAVAIIDEGTGVDASYKVAAQAGIPICVVYQGGEGLVDPKKRPNVFRIAPTDHGVAFRYAEYLVPQGHDIAFLHDDSGYGQEGQTAFEDAFTNPNWTVADITLPSNSSDMSAQVLQARRGGAGKLLVWARASTIAEVLRAARSSGWNVPVYAPPSGEDPLIRQSLSDHPSWLNGFTFASGRMTSEKGAKPFLRFQSAYESAFGPDYTGVKTSDGKRVYQPPDYAMYPYDFVRLLGRALTAGNSIAPEKITNVLNSVDVIGANGDERGFNSNNHDGVVDDDVYFAQLHDMVYRPVDDDPLSKTLPVIAQTHG